MKKIIFLGGMVIIGALVVLNATNTSEVINQITATTTVEVLPEWAEDEDAVEAAQAVIRRKELEVELSNLEAGFASTTAQYNAAKAVYLSEKERIEKELGTY